jgi:flap endonuclease-1
MLVGTDYNTGGIKGVGPKTALKLVKEHSKPIELFTAVEWGKYFEYPWQDVIDLFEKPALTDDYLLNFTLPNKDKLIKILCEKHDFALSRVEKTLNELEKTFTAKKQKGLGDFFSQK